MLEASASCSPPMAEVSESLVVRANGSSTLMRHVDPVSTPLPAQCVPTPLSTFTLAVSIIPASRLVPQQTPSHETAATAAAGRTRDTAPGGMHVLLGVSDTHSMFGATPPILSSMSNGLSFDHGSFAMKGGSRSFEGKQLLRHRFLQREERDGGNLGDAPQLYTSQASCGDVPNSRDAYRVHLLLPPVYEEPLCSSVGSRGSHDGPPKPRQVAQVTIRWTQFEQLVSFVQSVAPRFTPPPPPDCVLFIADRNASYVQNSSMFSSAGIEHLIADKGSPTSATSVGLASSLPTAHHAGMLGNTEAEATDGHMVTAEERESRRMYLAAYLTCALSDKTVSCLKEVHDLVGYQLFLQSERLQFNAGKATAAAAAAAAASSQLATAASSQDGASGPSSAFHNGREQHSNNNTKSRGKANRKDDKRDSNSGDACGVAADSEVSEDHLMLCTSHLMSDTFSLPQSFAFRPVSSAATPSAASLCGSSCHSMRQSRRSVAARRDEHSHHHRRHHQSAPKALVSATKGSYVACPNVESDDKHVEVQTVSSASLTSNRSASFSSRSHSCHHSSSREDRSHRHGHRRRQRADKRRKSTSNSKGDEATAANARSAPPTLLNEEASLMVEECFRLIDTDGDGAVTLGSITRFLLCCTPRRFALLMRYVHLRDARDDTTTTTTTTTTTSGGGDSDGIELSAGDAEGNGVWVPNWISAALAPLCARPDDIVDMPRFLAIVEAILQSAWHRRQVHLHNDVRETYRGEYRGDSDTQQGGLQRRRGDSPCTLYHAEDDIADYGDHGRRDSGMRDAYDEEADEDEEEVVITMWIDHFWLLQYSYIFSAMAQLVSGPEVSSLRGRLHAIREAAASRTARQHTSPFNDSHSVYHHDGVDHVPSSDSAVPTRSTSLTPPSSALSLTNPNLLHGGVVIDTVAATTTTTPEAAREASLACFDEVSSLDSIMLTEVLEAIARTPRVRGFNVLELLSLVFILAESGLRIVTPEEVMRWVCLRPFAINATFTLEELSSSLDCLSKAMSFSEVFRCLLSPPRWRGYTLTPAAFTANELTSPGVHSRDSSGLASKHEFLIEALWSCIPRNTKILALVARVSPLTDPAVYAELHAKVVQHHWRVRGGRCSTCDSQVELLALKEAQLTRARLAIQQAEAQLAVREAEVVRAQAREAELLKLLETTQRETVREKGTAAVECNLQRQHRQIVSQKDGDDASLEDVMELLPADATSGQVTWPGPLVYRVPSQAATARGLSRGFQLDFFLCLLQSPSGEVTAGGEGRQQQRERLIFRDEAGRRSLTFIIEGNRLHLLSGKPPSSHSSENGVAGPLAVTGLSQGSGGDCGHVGHRDPHRDASERTRRSLLYPYDASSSTSLRYSIAGRESERSGGNGMHLTHCHSPKKNLLVAAAMAAEGVGNSAATSHPTSQTLTLFSQLWYRIEGQLDWSKKRAHITVGPVAGQRLPFVVEGSREAEAVAIHSVEVSMIDAETVEGLAVVDVYPRNVLLVSYCNFLLRW